MISIIKNDGSKLPVHTITSIGYDYIALLDEIIVLRNRDVKLNLDEDFLKSVVPDTLSIFVTPVDSPYNYKFDVRYSGKDIYIRTNARTRGIYYRYAKLRILVIGIRWDTYVVNKIIQELGDKL